MPIIVSVADPDDPRIADYRVVRERDLVGRQDLFVAEGEVVVRHLVRTPLHEPVSLLVAEKRLKALEPLIAHLPHSVPVFSATQDVMDRVVGFPIHRGILAIGRRRIMPSADELLAASPPRAMILVLFGVANHDNMGGILRNAAAFGAAAVILDSACCDPLYRKAIRVSVGAALIVPFARLGSGEDALELLHRCGFEPIGLSPSGATAVSEVACPDRAAVLLGSEGQGLPENVLARTNSVRIPMASGFDSLNVATASGIVLHHLASAPLSGKLQESFVGQEYDLAKARQTRNHAPN